MKILGKVLKWAGIVIIVILLIALAGYLYIYNQTEKRFHKKYEVTLKPIEFRQDSATYALGKHLSVIRGCIDCHGDRLQGGFVINDPPVGVVYAPNLTAGKGSKTTNYTDEDWIRSIKHGVNPEGKALWIMPSYEYDLLSEEDLAALILYVKNAEPVDGEMVLSEIGPVGRILTNFDKIPLLAAEMIDHGPKEGIAAVKPEETAAYGKYMSTSCIGCHRDNLQGVPHWLRAFLQYLILLPKGM
ncbi:hypothetical protein BH23BAC1_BH23BAC1_29840 [soil metagenome]